MQAIKIKGYGAYLPPLVVTNDDMSKLVETNDEWIVSRTGIKERRISEGEDTSSIAQKAARLALERANIKVDKYYSSEIDKNAIVIADNNYSQDIKNKLGDITKWREWDIDDIDLVIGGSPCQGFSIAGKQLNFKDERSKLVFDYIDIVNHFKPKYFLLENVKMAKECQDEITRLLGTYIFPKDEWEIIE